MNNKNLFFRSLENYTLEIVPEKVENSKKSIKENNGIGSKPEVQHLNNAFLTQSDTLNIENHVQLTQACSITSTNTTSQADVRHICSTQMDRTDLNSLLKVCILLKIVVSVPNFNHFHFFSYSRTLITLWYMKKHRHNVSQRI